MEIKVNLFYILKPSYRVIILAETWYEEMINILGKLQAVQEGMKMVHFFFKASYM